MQHYKHTFQEGEQADNEEEIKRHRPRLKQNQLIVNSVENRHASVPARLDSFMRPPCIFLSCRPSLTLFFQFNFHFPFYSIHHVSFFSFLNKQVITAFNGPEIGRRKFVGLNGGVEKRGRESEWEREWERLLTNTFLCYTVCVCVIVKSRSKLYIGQSTTTGLV